MRWIRPCAVISLTVAAGVMGVAASGPGPVPAASTDEAAALETVLRTPPSRRDDWSTFRVGGDLFTISRRVSETEWACGPCRITTALPEGYPAPTPPGAIELKRYPGVRRAEFSGNGNADRGMTMGFWPLFRHIQRHNIAMTSPVEVDYHGLVTDGDPSGGGEVGGAVGEARGEERPGWTMSFLYRTKDLREPGRDGNVVVQDAEPVTVVSIGVRGGYSESVVRAGVKILGDWLASQDEWSAAGEARAMYYNGPEMPRRDAWAEIQLPIRPRTPMSLGGQPAGR
ncbi:MAG: heme-binding protein [Phycisphaeraceae bacterium]|nr:MAG: heme-binding protein [Phycisphaeraceae bacterium]